MPCFLLKKYRLRAWPGIEMSYFLHGVSCVQGRVEELPVKMGEALQAMGGRILSSREVDRIRMEEKKAMGVHLKDGQELTAKVVISNIDAYTTFVSLMAEEDLPSRFRAQTEGTETLPFLFHSLPWELRVSWTSLSTSNHEVFFSDRLQEEYQAIYKNKVPEEAPFYLLAPSKVNPSHAPEGKKHPLSQLQSSLSLEP